MPERRGLSALPFLILVFCFSCAASSPARADAAAQSFPQELEPELSAGTSAVYHLDFRAAEAHFQRAIHMAPEHPAPYFFMTVSRWYRMTYDSLLYRNEALAKEFEDQADLTISVAKKFAKRGNEAVGDLYWGGGLGAKGWHYVSRGQWARAYFSGRKGYNLTQKVVEIDPELYDAYLGLGMYEYYAATLGPALKALSSFLVRGNRGEAMRFLHMAEVKTKYVRFEASYFLWNAFLEEGLFADAGEKVETLARDFPDSPLFKWCEIQTLFYRRDWEQVLVKGEEYIYRAHASPQPENYSNPYALLLGKVFYHCGAAAYNLKKPALAKAYFFRAIEQPSEFAGWRAMSYLRRGEILDLEGRREEAVGNYRMVLNSPKFWDSHRLARERIRSPYSRQDDSGIFHSPLQQWQKELEGR